MTYYGIPHLQTIANVARMAEGFGDSQPIETALTSCHTTACAVLSRKDGLERSPEDIEAHRELLATVIDVRSGFVSPTIGKVANLLDAMVKGADQ